MNDIPRELRLAIIICLPCPSLMAFVSAAWAAMFASEAALRAILDAVGRRARRHLLAHLAGSNRKISNLFLCKYILYQPRLIAHVGDEGFVTIPHDDRRALIKYIAWDDIIITAVPHSCHDRTQIICRSTYMPFHWVLYKRKYDSYLENVLDMLMWLDPLHYVQFSSLSARYVDDNASHLTPSLYSDKLSLFNIARYSTMVDWAVVSARDDITALLVDFADKLDWAIVCRGNVIDYPDDSYENRFLPIRGLASHCKYCRQRASEPNHKRKESHIAAVRQFHIDAAAERRRRAARQNQYGADDNAGDHHWHYDI